MIYRKVTNKADNQCNGIGYCGALRKILCKKESKQIRKQITNMVFRLLNGGIHLPVLAARSMLYDGMRTAGVNNGIRHRAY